MHVQAAAGPFRERLRHEARGHAVLARDGLDRALQQHAVVGGELGARDVVQVDLELAGREFLERRARGNVLRLAGREEVREERIGVLDVLHAAVLRTGLDLARAGNHSDFRCRPIGVGLEQVELELGRGDRRESHLLQRLHGMSQHLARIREERPALRVVHREQHLRRRHVRPGHGRERAGHRGRDRVGIAVAPAVVDAVEGEALGVEQDGRAAEIEAVGEGLRELAASDALAAQDPEHVRLQELELLRVRIPLQELLELFRHALGRLAHELLPARQAMAALAPSRLSISLNSRDSAVSDVSIATSISSAFRMAWRMPPMSRLRLIACFVMRTALASLAAMRCASASASSSRLAAGTTRLIEAHRLDLGGAHAVIAGEQQVLRRLRSGEPRQEQRDDAAAEFHFRLAEAAIVRGDREVAGEGELHRAAEAVAVDGGDGRLRAIPEADDDPEIVLERAADGRRLGLAVADAHVEIEACREGATGAGEHDRAHRLVRLGRVERAIERLDHRHVDGVQLVGPVERQERDRAPALRKDERFRHDQPSFKPEPRGLRLRVALEAVEALVARIARLLEAAEGLRHVALVEGVDPDDAGLDAAHEPECRVEVARPDAGREAVDRVVRDLDRLVRAVELDHRGDRSEDLLARDRHVVLDAREERGIHVGALLELRGRVAAELELRAFLAALLDHAEHALLVAVRDERTHVGVRVERVARLEGVLAELDEALDEFLADRAVDEQARARVADLAHVRVDAAIRRRHRAVEVLDVGHEDLRRLAAAFERDLLHVRLSRVLQDQLADGGRAGERDLADVLVQRERLAGFLAEAVHDIEDARRAAGFDEELREPQAAERRLLGGLQYDRVAGRERGRDLPGRHQERVVPGRDRADDAIRARAAPCARRRTPCS